MTVKFEFNEADFLAGVEGIKPKHGSAIANPSHIKDIEASGISIEQAEAAGIFSVPPDKIGKAFALCGWGNISDTQSMLAFTYRSLNGGGIEGCRFKPFPAVKFSDKGGREQERKYIQPKGSPNHFYLPVGVNIKGSDPIYLTEGEKKALSMTVHGFPCIGLGGIWNFRNGAKGYHQEGNKKLIKDFHLVNWRGREIYIVFDSDIAVNPNIAKAEDALAQEILKAGGRVWLIRLPYGEGLPKGVDDYLVAYGATCFNDLERFEVKPRATIADIIFDVEDFFKLDIPPKKIILHPWIEENSIIQIFADRGTGKTMFVMSLFVAVVRGESFGPWETITPVNCLYLDGEMAAQDTTERFLELLPDGDRCKLFVYSDAYANLIGLPKANLLDPKWRSAMKDILLKLNVKLWAIDNLSSLSPGIDENSRQDWEPINTWLLELRFVGITTIILHHTNKTGGQRGTHAREDNLDISICLERPKDYRPEEGARFVAKFTKARIRNKDLPLIADTEFCLESGEHGESVWTFGNVRKKNKAEIIRMLGDGIKAKDICESLGIDKGLVSRIKTSGIKEGLLTDNGQLTQNGMIWLAKN
jgi:putative DNA primase/helicase